MRAVADGGVIVDQAACNEMLEAAWRDRGVALAGGNRVTGATPTCRHPGRRAGHARPRTQSVRTGLCGVHDDRSGTGRRAAGRFFGSGEISHDRLYTQTGVLALFL